MEVKKLILVRVPPGDNWRDAEGKKKEIFPSLTEGLEYAWQKTGIREFHLSPLEGKVFTVEEADDPVIPEKKYSLYDE